MYGEFVLSKNDYYHLNDQPTMNNKNMTKNIKNQMTFQFEPEVIIKGVNTPISFSETGPFGVTKLVLKLIILKDKCGTRLSIH